jgi:hypothetical protein
MSTKSAGGELGLGDKQVDGKKSMIQHIEDTAELRYGNRVNETVEEDGQGVDTMRTRESGAGSGVVPAPPAGHDESALDDEELEDLPDFVVGVLRMVVGEDEVVGSDARSNDEPSTGKLDERTTVGGEGSAADKSIGGAVKGFFAR